MTDTLDFKIVSNEPLARDVYKMTLAGDTSGFSAPGQFVNVRLDGFYLRRPISVCDYDSEGLTLIYKTVGSGTVAMSRLTAGDALNLLTALGNGFTVNADSKKPLVIGGGVGVPPMYGVAKKIIEGGITPTVILGFNSVSDVFYEHEFKSLGCETVVTTADGSYGVKGFVTDAMAELEYDYFYTCGPEPMFKAIYNQSKTSGQFSFEKRMGCGFGACMVCSCQTKYGNKRICKDGPVLVKEEIIW